jgi:hypothetical protein
MNNICKVCDPKFFMKADSRLYPNHYPGIIGGIDIKPVNIRSETLERFGFPLNTDLDISDQDAIR